MPKAELLQRKTHWYELHQKWKVAASVKHKKLWFTSTKQSSNTLRSTLSWWTSPKIAEGSSIQVLSLTQITNDNWLCACTTLCWTRIYQNLRNVVSKEGNVWMFAQESKHADRIRNLWTYHSLLYIAIPHVTKELKPIFHVYSFRLSFEAEAHLLDKWPTFQKLRWYPDLQSRTAMTC